MQDNNRVMGMYHAQGLDGAGDGFRKAASATRIDEAERASAGPANSGVAKPSTAYARHSKRQNICASATVVLATKPPNGQLSISEKQQVSKQGTRYLEPYGRCKSEAGTPWQRECHNACTRRGTLRLPTSGHNYDKLTSVDLVS